MKNISLLTNRRTFIKKTALGSIGLCSSSLAQVNDADPAPEGIICTYPFIKGENDPCAVPAGETWSYKGTLKGAPQAVFKIWQQKVGSSIDKPPAVGFTEQDSRRLKWQKLSGIRFSHCFDDSVKGQKKQIAFNKLDTTSRPRICAVAEIYLKMMLKLETSTGWKDILIMERGWRKRVELYTETVDGKTVIKHVLTPELKNEKHEIGNVPVTCRLMITTEENGRKVQVQPQIILDYAHRNAAIKKAISEMSGTIGFKVHPFYELNFSRYQEPPHENDIFLPMHFELSNLLPLGKGYTREDIINSQHTPHEDGAPIASPYYFTDIPTLDPNI